MSERILTIDESYELVTQEIEGVLQAAEEAVGAAYWLTRMTGMKAEAKGDLVVAELTPENVEQLLRNYFEDFPEEGELVQIADCLRLMSPYEVEIVCDKTTGDLEGLKIIDDE